ncbi:MAG TPA: hypothetical protein VEW42_04550 [Candidatus Eisenbacteria bacterium]|nr:hypothetical protein [Candidatus Eisenbacteria bacterium]
MNAKSLKRIFYAIWPYLFLAVLLIGIFWQVFFKGYVFIAGDNFHLNIPLKYFFVDAFTHGYFPFWNPYMLGGMPFAAVLNLSVFNWLNVLYFIFPVPRALTIQAIIDLFLIGSFQFILLRSKNVSKTVSLIGGVCFMLSGTVFVFTDHIAILDPIIYIPIIFLLMGYFFERRKLRFLFLSIFIQFLQILSGHPQITYYTMLFVSFYILSQHKLLLWKRIQYCIMYILFSVGLASFQLIPFIELILHSNRPVGSLSYATSGSFDIAHLITIFFPTFFGTKLFGNWWGSQTMLTGYIGVASMLLLYLGIKYAQFREKSFYLFALVLSFLLSLGKFGLIYFLFYYFVPGWSSFRSPLDLLIFTTFFATLFVAQGVQVVLKKPNISQVFDKKIIAVSICICILSLVLILVTNFSMSWTRLFIFLSTIHMPFVNKILFYDVSKIQIVMNCIDGNIFVFFLLFLLTQILLWKFSRKKIFAYVLLVLISLNLVFVDYSYLQLAPLSIYNQSLPVPLKDAQNGMFRIFAKGIRLQQDRRFLPGPEYFYNEAKANTIGITDNRAVPLRLYSITGYSSLVLQNYATFTLNNNITGITQSHITNNMLDELGVKYILNVDTNENLHITQNPNAMPRIRLLQSGGSIHIIKDLPNTIVLFVNSPIKNAVILVDSYYPGWEVLVNGKKEKIQLFNKTFRSVVIAPGTSRIVFEYNSFSWKIGIGFSVLFFTLACFYIYKYKKYV